MCLLCSVEVSKASSSHCCVCCHGNWMGSHVRCCSPSLHGDRGFPCLLGKPLGSCGFSTWLGDPLGRGRWGWALIGGKDWGGGGLLVRDRALVIHHCSCRGMYSLPGKNKTKNILASRLELGKFSDTHLLTSFNNITSLFYFSINIHMLEYLV